jgi:hypothetical protein
MNPLHDELRRALRRVDAPEGFADRVRARIETRATAARVTNRAWIKTAVALAATLAIVAGGTWYRAQGQRRAQGEEAKRQVLLSLSIAGNKLRAIEMKVNHREDR